MESLLKDLVMMQSHTNPKLARKIADELEIPWNAMSINYFGKNGCTLPKFVESVRGKTVLILETQTDPVNDNYVIAQQIIRAIAHDANRVYMLMPNYFYERSDKKDQSHSCEFASVVYDTFSMLGVRGIWTNDLHNDSIVSNEREGVFINHLSIMDWFVHKIIELGLKDYALGVCDSDVKLVENFASRLNYQGELIVFPSFRKRNDNTKQYGDPTGQVKPGQDVILVDDQSPTGGTVISAATKLKEQKNVDNIYVFVTKIWPTEKFVMKIEESPITKFFTSDSTAFDKSILTDKFEVISLAPLYATAVKSWILHEPFPNQYKFSMK